MGHVLTSAPLILNSLLQWLKLALLAANWLHRASGSVCFLHLHHRCSGTPQGGVFFHLKISWQRERYKKGHRQRMQRVTVKIAFTKQKAVRQMPSWTPCCQWEILVGLQSFEFFVVALAKCLAMFAKWMTCFWLFQVSAGKCHMQVLAAYCFWFRIC